MLHYKVLSDRICHQCDVYSGQTHPAETLPVPNDLFNIPKLGGQKGVYWSNEKIALQWRHNERDGVSNQQLRDCLFNRLFRCKPKETSALHVTGLCQATSPMTGEFLAQRARNTKNVSIWWRHHDTGNLFPHSLAYCWCCVIIFSWSPHVLWEVTLHKTRFLPLAKIHSSWVESRKRILITYLLSKFFYHCKASGVFKHSNTQTVLEGVHGTLLLDCTKKCASSIRQNLGQLWIFFIRLKRNTTPML